MKSLANIAIVLTGLNLGDCSADQTTHCYVRMAGGIRGGEGYVGAGGLDGLCLCYGSITAGYLSTLKVVHA